MSLSCPDYPVRHLKVMQVLTQKLWLYILNICFVVKFFVVTIIEATMMLVEMLRGEAEMASGINNMIFFLLSVIAI